MSHRGHYLASASGRQVSEESRHDLAADVGKSVSVEEKKRGGTMKLAKNFYGFEQGEDLVLFCCPLSCARFLSLSIKAVLRASSCARSSIEADDKLPTPVFEKLGSGL
jgi:hypothetical protein